MEIYGIWAEYKIVQCGDKNIVIHIKNPEILPPDWLEGLTVSTLRKLEPIFVRNFQIFTSGVKYVLY